MNTLSQLLTSIDDADAKLREHDIYQPLDTYKKSNASDNNPDLYSEIIAFAFSEYFDDTNRRAFYKLLMTLKNKNGEHMSFPSPMHLTCEMLEYWQKRAMDATHPVMKMRYAGLVWVFHKEINKSKPPHEMSSIIIDSIELIANKTLHKHELSIITKLKYGLHLAISITNDVRIRKIANSILDYEKNAGKGDTVADAWSTSFDHLLQNKKILLSDEQKEEIINRIESRLDNLVKAMPLAAGITPIREVAIRLAKFYQNSPHTDKIENALVKYLNSAIQLADGVSPIGITNMAYRSFSYCKAV